MDRVREGFIERMGLATEADGLSRIAGRLFGALLLSEAPRSLDELAESLGVSKASASVEARRLLDRGVAERVGKPGDRRDYYQLAPDFFERVIRRRIARWDALHDLVTGMQRSAPTRSAVIRDRFAHIDRFHAFVVSRIDEALDEWAASQARPTPPPSPPARPHRAARAGRS